MLILYCIYALAHVTTALRSFQGHIRESLGHLSQCEMIELNVYDKIMQTHFAVSMQLLKCVFISFVCKVKSVKTQ